MNLDLLTAISPIDGRYRGKTEPLANYFSEYALIRYRVRVEIEYFITLCELPLPQLASFDKTLFERLRDIYRNFDEACAARVKDIEKITNHADAIEYADDMDKSQVGVEIHSGKNRIVRRIFESLGYRVVKLDRVQFAGLTKKNLRRGDWRFLTEQEVEMLRSGMFE